MQEPTRDIDPIAFRNACGGFATGVTVITTRHDDTDHGMTANAFMSISLDPPLVAVSIAKTARMLELVRGSGRYAVSVLPEGTEDVAMHFAGRPKEGVDVPLHELDGLPVAPGACATLCTDVDQSVDAGDHVIFVGRVTMMHAAPALHPLMYHKGRFGKLEPVPGADSIDPEFLWEGAHW